MTANPDKLERNDVTGEKSSKRMRMSEEQEEEKEEGAEEGVKEIPERGDVAAEIKEGTNIYRILGQEIKNAVLEKQDDWQKRRKEILEKLKDDEEERRKRIERASRL